MKNTDNNLIKTFVILSIIFFVLGFVLTGISMIKNDKITGFAVDDEDRLYIGKNSRIEVYDSGTIEKTISSVTNRGYSFTIKDGEILILTGSALYHLDLEGNVKSSELFSGIGRKDLGKFFEDSNGNCYELKKTLGRTLIMKNENEKIFQEPLNDYILKCAVFFTRLLFVLCSLPLLIIAKLNLTV